MQGVSDSGNVAGQVACLYKFDSLYNVDKLHPFELSYSDGCWLATAHCNRAQI